MEACDDVTMERLELKEDVDGRRSWWGSGEGVTDQIEVGDKGLFLLDSAYFEIGTVIQIKEPVSLRRNVK